MAITIESNPADFLPASNTCEFTFSSTNTGEENFSYLVRLDINGASHSFHQVFPESGSVGRFDASEILRSYVSSQLITSGVIELSSSTYAIEYDIAVKEKYGTPAIEVGSFVDSSTRTAINGALRDTDWIDYDYTDYQIDTNTSGLTDRLFMSKFPSDRSRFCGTEESQFLGVICTDTAANVRIILKSAGGGTVATVVHTLSVPSNDLFILDISPETLINDTTLTRTNFKNAYSYEVRVEANGTGGNGSSTVTETIIIDRECSLYDGKRLHWLNKFGVWESFTFKLYHEETTSVKSKQYQKSLGTWSGTNTREYNRYNGEKTFISKSSEDKLELNSDWIHEDVQQWLSRSLYESPLAYLEVSQGVFEPVLVSKSSYTQKQRIKEGLIQENVKVDRTYIFRSQLG